MGFYLLFTYLINTRQIEIDSRFLETQHIMDYSLLLGVHYRAPHHLRSQMHHHLQSAGSDGLAVVSEEGQLLAMFFFLFLEVKIVSLLHVHPAPE